MADDEFEPDDVGEDFDEVEDDADIDEIDQQEVNRNSQERMAYRDRSSNQLDYGDTQRFNQPVSSLVDIKHSLEHGLQGEGYLPCGSSTSMYERDNYSEFLNKYHNQYSSKSRPYVGSLTASGDVFRGNPEQSTPRSGYHSQKGSSDLFKFLSENKHKFESPLKRNFGQSDHNQLKPKFRSSFEQIEHRLNQQSYQERVNPPSEQNYDKSKRKYYQQSYEERVNQPYERRDHEKSAPRSGYYSQKRSCDMFNVPSANKHNEFGSPHKRNYQQSDHNQSKQTFRPSYEKIEHRQNQLSYQERLNPPYKQNRGNYMEVKRYKLPTKLNGQPLDSSSSSEIEMGISIAEAAFRTASTNRGSGMEVSEVVTISEENRWLQSPALQPEERMENAENRLNRLKLKPSRPSGAQPNRRLELNSLSRGVIFKPSNFRPFHKDKLAAERSQTRVPKRGQYEGPTPSPFEQNGRKRTRAAIFGSKPENQGSPGESKGKLKDKSIAGGTKDKPWDLAAVGGSEETFKTALNPIKLAVVPENYPTVKLSEEQGELVQTALLGAIASLEDGDCAQLSGSYIKRGAVILLCLNRKTEKWVLSTAPNLTPWEGAKLVAGYRNILSPVMKVVLRTPKQLASKEPSQIMVMLAKQNASFDVPNWKIISNKKEANGQTLVFLVDDTAMGAIKAAGSRAYLFLWRVPLIVLNRGNAKGSASKPPSQRMVKTLNY